MRIDPAHLDAEKAYRLITGIVVPRPIAWVTSLSARGVKPEFVPVAQK